LLNLQKKIPIYEEEKFIQGESLKGLREENSMLKKIQDDERRSLKNQQ
jgi:hypothetical protein